VTFFEQAKPLFPEWSYPKDKLEELKRLIAEEASRKTLKNETARKLEQKYQENITRGNAAFDLRRYSEAKGYYDKALAVRPDASYPKEQLAEIYKKINEMRERAAEQQRLQDEAIKRKAAKPTQEKERYLSELALEYPEGITEETYNEGDKKIVRRILVKEGRSDDYRMVIQPWGARFYFKNDQSIPKHQFDRETTNID
jgi:tetratricopeptide (TPR) repeat protein